MRLSISGRGEDAANAAPERAAAELRAIIDQKNRATFMAATRRNL